ncbi:hypothetical protein [Streptomyces sp. 6N223]|uniref:hypothetical protein n=1 Tax=Streptomyces sp. 6N223 TaxID=3457412 RepID=UPI003FD5B56D
MSTPTPTPGPAPMPMPVPGGRPAHGRAPAEHAPGYIVSAVLLLAFAGGIIAWLVDGIRTSDSSLGDLLRAMVQPSHPVDAPLLTPYEWVYALALITVAVLALLLRRVARGGALVLAFLLLAICLRQAVGSLDAHYREGFEDPDYGTWTLLTYGVGLAIAVTVLVLLLPARERPAGPAPLPRPLPGLGPVPGFGAPRPRPASPYLLAGGLLVAVGVVQAAWAIDRQQQLDDAGYMAFGDYLRDIVDPSLFHSPLSISSGLNFYEAALVVTLIITGVLALLGREVARGAALTAAGMAAYLEARTVVFRFEAGHWDTYFDSVRGTLTVLSMIFTALAIVTAVIALLAAGVTAARRDVRSVW